MTLSELYQKVKKTHPEIHSVSFDELGRIEETNRQCREAELFPSPALLLFSSLLFYTLCSTVLVILVRYLWQWTGNLEYFLVTSDYICRYPPIGIGILVTLIPLLIQNYWAWSSPRPSPFHIDQKINFVGLIQIINWQRALPPLYIISADYFGLFLGLLWLQDYLNSVARWPRTAIFAFLLIPSLYFATLLLLNILALSIRPFLHKNPRFRETAPAAVVASLLVLLNELASLENLDAVTLETKDKLSKTILSVADMVRQIGPAKPYRDPIDCYTATRMVKAGNSVASWVSLIYLATPDSLGELTKRAKNHLNIFLTGSYDLLPEEPIVEADKLRASEEEMQHRSLWPTVLLGIYLLLPVATMTIISILTPLRIDPFVQTLMVILYVIWVLVGLAVYSESLSAKGKTYIDALLALLLRVKGG